MSRWLRELVKVDEADTRSGHHSNCWKVSSSRTHRCASPNVKGYSSASGLAIYKGAW